MRAAAFVLAFLLAAPSASGAEPTAREIAEKALAATKVASLRQKTTMTLVDAKGGTRVREMRITRTGDDGKDGATRIEFLSPKDVAGTVLLTVWKKGDATQHLWLPNLKRVRRVAGGSRGGAFMGSDFTFEDLAGRDLDDFEMTLLPEEDGHYAIEAKPKKGVDSAYAKSVTLVRKSDFFTLRVRFFDAKGAELKTLEIDPAKTKPAGAAVLPLSMTMTSKKDGHKTVLETSEVEVAPKLDASTFDPASLEKG